MKKTSVEIARMLLKRLWENYSARVPYARVYQELVESRGGHLAIDHLAFRSFNTHTGEQPEGIEAAAHIFKCCGYKPAGEYHFPQKKLFARHYEHQHESLPRIFISELEVTQLPDWAQQKIHDAVKDTLYMVSDSGIELMNRLKADGYLNAEAADVLVDNLLFYFERPWPAPMKDTVLRLNDVSQYAAWVLLHGNSVNHFAAGIGGNGAGGWPDMEAACQALAGLNVPMKDSIEGEKGSRLRQSATLAVKEETQVRGDEEDEKILWTYAYLELAERGMEEKDGQLVPFSGFLGPQAMQLFGMTKTRDN